MPVRLLLCLSLALPGIASAAAMTRGPFLQQTDARSTLVVLKTDVAASVRVVASPEGKDAVTGESAGTAHHVVRLEGLPPASEIPYVVEIDGAAVAEGVVTTPGVANTAAGRQAVLGVIGDFGTKGPIELGNGAQLLARQVDAVITVGDNAYPNGAVEDWDPAVFKPLAPLLRSTTFWPVAGDHEYLVPYAQPYLDAFELPEGPQGERYYSFDWGDVHVVAIDTNCISPVDPKTQGCDANTMLDWLRADLAATDAPWIVTTMHRPALATGKYGVYPAVQAALVPIFEEFGVDLVLQGHNHLYERSWPVRGGKVVAKDYERRGAPVYVTAGGGGDWLYDFVLPAAEWTAHREKIDQHLILTLDGGSLKVESVTSKGVVHDTFTIVKDVPALPDCEGDACVDPELPPEQPAPATPGSVLSEGCASGGGVSGLVALAGLALGVLLRRRARR